MNDQINGLTIADLAKQYGVSKPTIQKWRKELGIETVQLSASKIVIPDSELDRFDDLALIKLAVIKGKTNESNEVLSGGSLAISELQDDLIGVSEFEDDEIEAIKKEAESDEMIRSVVYYNTRYKMRNAIATQVRQREADLRDRKFQQVKELSSGRLALGK